MIIAQKPIENRTNANWTNSNRINVNKTNANRTIPIQQMSTKQTLL